jgi:UDP-glucose:(heptosyl)LPS alpha-1,3-glucosyltransferase
VSLRGVTVPGRLRLLRARHQVLLELERRTFASERYRRVMAVGQGVADDLVELYGVDRAKLVVVPNGFSAEQCNPTRRAELRPRMRAELGLGKDDIALLLVANELHRKGFGQLLEATARLDDERVHILLVGRLAPTPYQPTIDGLGLTHRVRWCGLADDVALYHAAADVFVMPTQYEAFGSVVVEALASGLPVITSALAGAAAAVVPDGNGLLQQDPLDVEELTELLRTALDPDRRRRWEETASPSVQDYEWSRVVAQVEDVLSSVSTAP